MRLNETLEDLPLVNGSKEASLLRLSMLSGRHNLVLQAFISITNVNGQRQNNSQKGGMLWWDGNRGDVIDVHCVPCLPSILWGPIPSQSLRASPSSPFLPLH